MTRWGWRGIIAVGIGGLLGMSANAAEHGGKEHGGSAPASAPVVHEHGGATHEHGGQAAAPVEPSAEQTRQAIEDYVQQIVDEDGAFTIDDDVTGTTRRLEFVRVHERVGKTGDLYYSCTDMRDADTGESLDLDFDVDVSGGELDVVDTRIHKVEGKARYTYDDHDQRIPVAQ